MQVLSQDYDTKTDYLQGTAVRQSTVDTNIFTGVAGWQLTVRACVPALHEEFGLKPNQGLQMWRNKDAAATAIEGENRASAAGDIFSLVGEGHPTDKNQEYYIHPH